MSRYIRDTGKNGYMHIVKRGINHQDVFLDAKDYEYFKQLLFDLRDEMGFKIIAYCLMSNHMHILLYDDQYRFSYIVQRLYTKYAKYFNKKYDRTGGLFEGRYCGKTVDTEQYLITAVRYIHNNPLNAGICLASDYLWSSYNEYVSDLPENMKLCSTTLVLSIFGGSEAFIRFHHSSLGENAYKHVIDIMKMEGNERISDNEIRHIIQSMTNSKSPFIIQSIDRESRDEILVKLKRMGLKYSQIARITGVSLGAIKKAGKHSKNSRDPKKQGTKVPAKK